MRIGEVAAEAGVPTKTIRFWESQGLLPEPTRTASGYRDYSQSIVERLAFIRHAQRAGFRLEEIRQVMGISDAGESACEHVAALVAEHIATIDQRITELTQTRLGLSELAQRAAAQDPRDCQGLCRIIQGDHKTA